MLLIVPVADGKPILQHRLVVADQLLFLYCLADEIKANLLADLPCCKITDMTCVDKDDVFHDAIVGPAFLAVHDNKTSISDPRYVSHVPAIGAEAYRVPNIPVRSLLFAVYDDVIFRPLPTLQPLFCLCEICSPFAIRTEAEGKHLTP